MVVINKIDKPESRPDGVIDEVFDLFTALDANDEQLDFPILYASGRDGWCVKEVDDEQKDLTPLLELIVNHVEAPDVDTEAPFSMLVTLLDADPFVGRMLTGRIYSGSIATNSAIKAIDLDGNIIESGRLTKLFTFDGVERVPTETAEAGDIVCVAGLEKASVANTIGEPSIEQPIPSTPIDPPTMAITVSVNDSPYAGQDGSKVTSRMIRDRLLAEAETNVAITVEETAAKDAFEVGGRGELQLGVLIETMRREGFELSVSRPKVLLRKDPDTGATLEPIEEVVADVDDEYSGSVVEKISQRKGEMTDMRASGGGKTRITFLVPSRGLIGYQSEFLTDTRGTGILNRLYHSHAPYKGDITHRRNGALISTDQGEAVAYAIFNLQDRGIMFIKPQDKVYAGMIVGEHSRDNDLEVNVLKGKQLTNVRASGSDEAVRLTPPKELSLEEMISYIEEDELLEVTPNTLRLRKTMLDSNDRKRASRAKKKEAQAN
jgi:GTP-binding protein